MLLCLTESRYVVQCDQALADEPNPRARTFYSRGRHLGPHDWKFSVRHRDTGEVFGERLRAEQASQLRFRLARENEAPLVPRYETGP